MIRKKQGKLWLNMIHGDLCDPRTGARIPDESVDVVVTSAPYKEGDGYSDVLMQQLGALCQRVLKPGGRLFLVFGQLRPKRGFDVPYLARAGVQAGAFFWAWRCAAEGALSERQVNSQAKKVCLTGGQTICWVKSLVVPSWKSMALNEAQKIQRELEEPWHCQDPYEQAQIRIKRAALRTKALIKALKKGQGTPTQIGHYTPINSDKTLSYGWEFVFTFSKPPEDSLDKLSVGVPFTDKSNMKRGGRGKHGDLHDAGDVWFIPYETTGAKKKKASNESRNAYEYPVELARRCLKVSGAAARPGAVVLDPFMGTGTTAEAAKELGLNTWGIEINELDVAASVERWLGRGE